LGSPLKRCGIEGVLFKTKKKGHEVEGRESLSQKIQISPAKSAGSPRVFYTCDDIKRGKIVGWLAKEMRISGIKQKTWLYQP